MLLRKIIKFIGMNSQGLQRPFNDFSLQEQIEMLNTNGAYITYRIYYSYKVSLYSIGKSFVETWFDYKTDKVTTVLDIDLASVQKVYCSHFKIK